MTRKDYVLLAQTLGDAYRTTRPSTDTPAEYVLGCHDGIRIAALFIARALADINARFDRGRFMRDAGIPDTNTEEA